MERGGLGGRNRGGGRGRSTGRGRGRGGQQQQEHHQGRGSSSSSSSSSNQGWSRGHQVGPTQSHAHMGPGRGGSPSRSVWGAGRAGPSFAQVLSRETLAPSATNADSGPPVVSTMASLNISVPSSSSSSSPSSCDRRLVPMKRPDNGGTRGYKVNLFVNHFPVKFDAEKIIWHFDVDVKSKVASKNGHSFRVSKSDLPLIRTQMSMDDPEQFPLEMTACDGKKIIFSAIELPAGEFTVQFSESSYLVTLKLVNKFRLSQLNDYLSGRELSVPRDILQGLDLATKENMSFHGADIGHGIVASRKPKHSLKLTTQGVALCLDYSVLPERKSVPVIEYLEEHIDGFNINRFGSFKDKVESALMGLKVYKTHLGIKRKCKIAGLTSEDAQDISFYIEDKKVGLVDYFRGKYGKDIMYKNIPCLELGKKDGTHSVPLELCVIAEGQRYPKELLYNDVAKKLKNLSLVSPSIRQDTIYDILRDKDGPFCGEVVQNFGMEIGMNMTKVIGRVLSPPDLNVGAPEDGKMKIKLDNEKCHWNLVGKRLIEAIQINCWAVLDFTSGPPRRCPLRPNRFIPKLINRCNDLGIQMGEPIYYQNARMRDLNSVNVLQEVLEKVRSSCERGRSRLQLLLCVMDEQDIGYCLLKFVSETKVGVMTQCCLSTHANEAKDQYIANLALKINAKLGGHHVEVIEPLTHFNGEGGVMFVGADVNHPGFKNLTSPSIAAVVASMSWPAPNKYAARIRPQDPKSEKIQDFAEMCLQLIDTYVNVIKVKPAKIIIFRDGVSESQFDMVLNGELSGLKKAFKAMNYFPTITVIVAQKRHQTRFFFPKTNRDRASSGNVLPGTVIDSTVVDPFGFHFFLHSQYGSIGTSKSTQYRVLYDEHGFSSDHIQRLIHSMCFTFARCTKSVSLIPPVSYADLAAYRGRFYQNVSEQLSQTSWRVHPDLQNSMYFI